MPKEWMPKVSMMPRKPGVKFVAAQGTAMKYYGRKNIKFRALRMEDGKVKTGSLSQMEFHVTDATKALAAASAIIEAGNDIVLSRKKRRKLHREPEDEGKGIPSKERRNLHIRRGVGRGDR